MDTAYYSAIMLLCFLVLVLVVIFAHAIIGYRRYRVFVKKINARKGVHDEVS